MRVHIIGVGLIGGSFSLDIKNAYSDVTLVGIDKNHGNLKRALELNIVDEIAEIEDVATSRSCDCCSSSRC